MQLTALAIRGPVTSGERFTVNLDRVAFREEVVRGVLLCVQDFERDPLFTQRNFSETGVTMLSEVPEISDSITGSSVYAPWSEVESGSSGQVIGDLKTCFEKALDRRRAVKGTSKQWYALGPVRPPSGESSSQYGVRISTVVEEVQVDYGPVVAPSRKVAAPSRHHSSPEKRKCPGAQLNCRVSLKFRALLPVLENLLWSKIRLSLLPWHLSLPVEKLGEVGEIGKLRLSSKDGCRN